MSKSTIQAAKQAFTEWLAALRSGDYAQGTKRLRTETGFCCLGVACDIAAKAGTGRWLNSIDDGWVFRLTEHAPNEHEWMPKGMQATLGLNPHWNRELAEMNDKGSSFVDIADFIEKTVMPEALAKLGEIARGQYEHQAKLARRRELYALKKAKAANTITIFN